MATRPIIHIHDETGEYDREMNDTEFADYQAMQLWAKENVVEPTVTEKLANVGLSITDLKAALGL